MSSRSWIVLAGGFGLPDRTASAVRAIGLAKLFGSIGYKSLILGKLPEDAVGSLLIQADIPCRDIRAPFGKTLRTSYVYSSESIALTVNQLGITNVKAVIAYNYPARGAYGTIRFCRRNGIAPVLDITEWYAWEGRKILRNLWRQAGVYSRILFLTRMAQNVICASSWFSRRLKGQHSVILPFALDTQDSAWQRRNLKPASGIPHFVYSGSPGIGMIKDQLPLMIDAFSRLSQEGFEFRVSIAGLSRAQFLKQVPSEKNKLDTLGDRTRFLGRITHRESLDLLRSSDFSVFFRKPDRMSNTGFPTKYVEAATLGIPVISNPTSDIPLYLWDGETGILAPQFDAASIEAALRRAAAMTPAQRSALVARCQKENPFDLRHWQAKGSEFLENLRGQRG